VKAEYRSIIFAPSGGAPEDGDSLVVLTGSMGRVHVVLLERDDEEELPELTRDELPWGVNPRLEHRAPNGTARTFTARYVLEIPADRAELLCAGLEAARKDATSERRA
jgi:hypothetical protein